MSLVKVNKIIWDALPEDDRNQITAHLQHFGVLQEGQQIIGDMRMPMPSIESLMKYGPGKGAHQVEALGVDWMCRAICDSMETKTNCVLYGQSSRFCMESITKHREVFELEVLHSDSSLY
jgi:hypothetical protein